MDRHGRMVHRGGEREVAVGEAVPLAQQHRSAAEVEPGDAHVLAHCGTLVHQDRIAVARGVFLDHDGVGARRQHPAGEDARGFAGADRAFERMSGRDLADDVEARRHAGDVGGAHGIAVHRRHVGRGLRAQGGKVVGQHAAVRFLQRRGFAG